MPVASLRAPEAAGPRGLPAIGNEASEARTPRDPALDVIADPAAQGPRLDVIAASTVGWSGLEAIASAPAGPSMALR